MVYGTSSEFHFRIDDSVCFVLFSTSCVTNIMIFLKTIRNNKLWNGIQCIYEFALYLSQTLYYEFDKALMLNSRKPYYYSFNEFTIQEGNA